VDALCNRFLTVKKNLADSQELSIRTFHSYHAGGAEIVDHFGRVRLVEDCKSEDFEAFRVNVNQGRGLHAIGAMVTLTKMLFTLAFDNELIDKPVRSGTGSCRSRVGNGFVQSAFSLSSWLFLWGGG